MTHGVKAMAIIVYCQHCGHDIAVFRKLRTPPELLQIPVSYTHLTLPTIYSV